MVVDNRLCLHCGTCVGSCPTNSIFLHELSTIEFLPDCTECGLCATVCPVGCIGHKEAHTPEPELGWPSEVRA